QAMGLWFTSLAMGNLLASRLAGSVGGNAHDIASYFMLMFEYGAMGAAALLVLFPLLRRWANLNQAGKNTA
ncbi:MAG TPA: hypothetical protein VKO83_11180, partial [Steroidobacteraceae bacterium]|nr:hypothetical protein [Steroidobacteraceae bacterium]